MREFAYVYILANGFKSLYIGVTTNLQRRVQEHKSAADPKNHTARYHIDQLVYFERFTSIGAAINREKQLKGWLRIRKVELIVGVNPDWKDLSAEWGDGNSVCGAGEGDGVGLGRLWRGNTGVLHCVQDDGVEQATASSTTTGSAVASASASKCNCRTTAAARLAGPGIRGLW